jgi:hypothetical protein
MVLTVAKVTFANLPADVPAVTPENPLRENDAPGSDIHAVDSQDYKHPIRAYKGDLGFDREPKTRRNSSEVVPQKAVAAHLPASMHRAVATGSGSNPDVPFKLDASPVKTQQHAAGNHAKPFVRKM